MKENSLLGEKRLEITNFRNSKTWKKYTKKKVTKEDVRKENGNRRYKCSNNLPSATPQYLS